MCSCIIRVFVAFFFFVFVFVFVFCVSLYVTSTSSSSLIRISKSFISCEPAALGLLQPSEAHVLAHCLELDDEKWERVLSDDAYA